MQAPVDEKDRRVLCVGLVCLDIVKLVAAYPIEDTAQRCLDCVWQRGGNASNTCTVLALLGQPVEFFGTVARSQEVKFLRDDFSKYGVQLDHVVECQDVQCPLSVAIVNTINGSRTLLHTNKNLRELCYEDFKTVDLSRNLYKWIHFECRTNTMELEKMLLHIQQHNAAVSHNRIITSIEFEKPRTESERLYQLADYLFLSKEFAQHSGCKSMEEAVSRFAEKTKQSATVICAWGEKGAAGKSSNSDPVTVPAIQLPQVVDTLAAGDTFIAATVFSLSKGNNSLSEALQYGCRVAGAKCGMRGLGGLASINKTT